MSTSANSDSLSVQSKDRKKKSRKKEKKQKIVLCLYINGVTYEYGLLCTFCGKLKAVLHCPECTDFYCASCDVTAHLTKKRKDHVRSKISKYSMDDAANVITRAIRYYIHMLLLRIKCRAKIIRFFDRVTLNYYYYNTVYDTVSWRKPYCLGREELFPYMKPEYAASKCQNLYYLWKARLASRTNILSQYSKIFDRRNGIFYYAYNGKSLLLPKQSWKKPKLLGKRSFPKDLVPIFTRDVAALIIQRKWRSILIRQFLCALVRATHDEVWDPVSGQFTYYHRDAEVLHKSKPKLLRSQPWDPNRVPDWSIERVSLFLRRIGLKRYVDIFKSYDVDGNTLVLLDDEDYANLNITNKLHITKIRVEIKRIYKPHPDSKELQMTEAHAQRRELIRRQKMFMAAATLIQTRFRMHSAKKELHLRKEIKRLKSTQFQQEQMRISGAIWWTELKNLPSKQMTTSGMIEFKGHMLPPIKTYGRHRDFLSHKGWGKNVTSIGHIQNNPNLLVNNNNNNNSNNYATNKSNHDHWAPSLLAMAAKNDFNLHPSIRYSEKLYISGYDEKRMKQFAEKSGLL
eukprot:gene9811-13202_t